MLIAHSAFLLHTLLQTVRSRLRTLCTSTSGSSHYLRQRLQATCTQYSSQYLRAASDERRAPAGGTGLSLAVCMRAKAVYDD